MDYKIATFPEPVLKQEGRLVEDIDDYIVNLAYRMRDIVKTHDALGLAAPQIFISLKLAVIRMLDEELVPLDTYIYVANPEIIEYSEEKDIEDEGCLSFPGVFRPVERPTGVKIKYLDVISGNEVETEFYGFQSRVIQHEVDHLNGVLFIDRMDKETRKDALKEYWGGKK